MSSSPDQLSAPSGTSADSGHDTVGRSDLAPVDGSDPARLPNRTPSTPATPRAALSAGSPSGPERDPSSGDRRVDAHADTGRVDAGGPTAALWRRRTPGSNSVACAAALTGVDRFVLSDALSISLAASDEAAVLLDGMELRVRTLTTSVESDTERCINSVRGPVLWSETITARANALGNEDVFVCATPSRSFDTVENRVLVAALEAIAGAGKALQGPTGEKVSDEEAARIARVAAEAHNWRRHHRLVDVRSTRLNGRDTARLRGGHRRSRMAPVLAVRDRVAEPFVAEDLDGLADAWTLRYHTFVLHTVDALSARFGQADHLTLADGGLWTGSTSFRHPAAPGGALPGLCHRGIPLLPRPEMVAGAPWEDALPVDGVRIASEGDLRRLLDRLAGGSASRRTRISSGATSRRPDQSSASSS